MFKYLFTMYGGNRNQIPCHTQKVEIGILWHGNVCGSFSTHLQDFLNMNAYIEIHVHFDIHTNQKKFVCEIYHTPCKSCFQWNFKNSHCSSHDDTFTMHNVLCNAN
jgi:hypothetical protein